MTRVIAVQEGQLEMIKGNYIKNIPSIVSPTNNADILNESLGVSEIPNVTDTPVSVGSQIDMEAQSVNLNPFEPQPIINPITTDEVFGVQEQSVDRTTTPNNPSIPEGTNSLMDFNAGTKSDINNLPYEDPMKNLDVNDEANVDLTDEYIKDLNSLRDKATDNYNQIIAEIDRIQEKLNQKTGVSLINNNESSFKETVVTNTLDTPMSVVGADIPVTNLLDNNDNTVIINQNDIELARNQMENGYAKVA